MSATTKRADTSRYVTKANLAGAFFENAAVLGDKPLLFHKSKGKWAGKDWNEVADSVRRLAGALVAAGLKPRDRIVISAENRPEWAIADLAVMSIGAIVVPAYTTNTEDDHVYIMEHSGALIAITSGGILASRVAGYPRMGLDGLWARSGVASGTPAAAFHPLHLPRGAGPRH